MVNLTKIYTRGGDGGETSLGDGSRRPKFDLRIDAIGEVDEANSFLGAAISCLLVSKNTIVDLRQLRLSNILSDKYIPFLQQCQNDLFDVGADLAVPLPSEDATKPRKTLRISEKHWQKLEQEIDRLNESLPPLDSFILPGGGAGAFADAVARLHLARAVTRRAERAVVHLASHENINPDLLRYLNRLSDYLFVAARYIAKVDPNQQSEVKWRPGGENKET
ncbi:MAG: cob(I)yrinic acid a,c-diamide adenosyltransferase [Candidatus Symbiobacter sp.]|nr:cob(I)yrinic acid a,c-diamide adenosyltransferase [Candidatus Symbiobacter sp.]